MSRINVFSSFVYFSKSLVSGLKVVCSANNLKPSFALPSKNLVAKEILVTLIFLQNEKQNIANVAHFRVWENNFLLDWSKSFLLNVYF